jgi:hypothetical protein
MSKYNKWGDQKEMLCPRCNNHSIFHKNVIYDGENIGPYGKPTWECGLCCHQVDRRSWENKLNKAA